MRSLTIVTLAALIALAPGCSFTSKATDISLPGPDGKKVAHVNQTNIAINFLFSTPLVGDASLQQTVADTATAASAAGGKNMRIVQSSSSTYWWIFPPFSFIIHPVVSNVAADTTVE